MIVPRISIILVHAIIGWALCGASVGVGRALTTMQNTLIIHAVLAPVFFIIISFIYFRIFNYTSPIFTAITFVGIVIALDAGLVAPFFERSYDMFKSFLGTWLPFMLIFLATYFTGVLARPASDPAG